MINFYLNYVDKFKYFTLIPNIFKYKYFSSNSSNIISKQNSNLKNDLNSFQNKYFLKWLQLFDNYEKIMNYKNSIKSGYIFAHQFSSLPIRCHGCGSFYHTNEKDKKGYILKEDLYWLMKNAISFYDMKCVNCKNEELKKILQIINKEEYKNELGFLEKKPTLYLHVIDVCNITSSIEAEYYRKCHKDSNIIFVVNKIDKISKDVINLKETIIKEINNKGKWNMNKIIDVICISCKEYYGVISLFKLLKKTALNRDICIVGISNVGKSSLFNIIQNVIHLGHQRENGRNIIPIQSSIGNISGITTGLIRHPITTKYLEEGYKYLRNLIIKTKEEKDFKINNEINQFGYKSDTILMNEIFLDDKNYLKDKNFKEQKNYIEKCLKSNAKDYKSFHQANSIYSTLSRIDFLNENITFDHNKFSWLYDTSSYNDNKKIEKICNQIKYIDNNETKTIKTKHIKLRQNSYIKIDDLINIKIKCLETNKFVEKNNQNESNHLDFFFYLFPKLLEFIQINDLNELQNETNFNISKIEFLGQGYNNVAIEIDFQSLGWITIYAPSTSIVTLSIESKNFIKPFVRTIPLIKNRPKNLKEKSYLNQFKTEGSIHNLELEIGKSIQKHVMYTNGQREYQIGQIQDYFINYEPKMHKIQHQHQFQNLNETNNLELENIKLS